MTQDQMEEIKRHFNVVAEGLQHEIKLIAEGHGTLHREIQETRHHLNEKIDLNNSLIKTAHDSLDAKIDETSNRLDAKIDAVRDELKDDIQTVGEKVDGHESRIQHLERRAA